jgi:NAD(P)-dependent dehydrogenase (short-subunit alcohol dehydrogenase family)
MSSFSLDGRIVVITGGSGRLGGAIINGLLHHGACVASVDLRSLDGEQVRSHERLMTLEGDVTDEGSLRDALATIEARWGMPHGLVNAAAIDSPPSAPAEENGPVERYPVDSLERIMRVNVTGSLLASRVFGGAMTRSGRGSVVNVGSIYGLISPDQRIYAYREQDSGEPFFKPISYSISKSALLNMTRYLATYWAGSSVRVNTVTFAGVFANQDARFLAAYTPKVPLGRMADPEECVGPIVFLLSDASSYVTGSNLVVDGGYTAW